MMKEEEANTQCLFCRASVDNDSPPNSKQFREDNQQFLGSTFDELCSLLDIEFPGKWDSWDFGEEHFPFCASCHGEIITVCDLSVQLRVFQNKVNAIIAQLSAVTLESESRDLNDNDKGEGGVTQGDGSLSLKNLTKPSDKYEFFRHSIIRRYAPNVSLQRLGNRKQQSKRRRIKWSFSSKNANTKDAKYPCKDEEENSHLSGAFGLSFDEDTNFEPSPSSPVGLTSDSEVEHSQVYDVNVSGHEDGRSKSGISKRKLAKEITAGPSSATKRRSRPRIKVDRDPFESEDEPSLIALSSDEDSDFAPSHSFPAPLVYYSDDSEHSPVNDANASGGEEYSSRSRISNKRAKVVKARSSSATKKTIDRKKTQVETVDEKTKTYAFNGIKFRETAGRFKCFQCLKTLTVREKKDRRFDNMRNHIRRDHAGEEPLERNEAELNDDEIRVLDEEAKIYSISGIQIQKVEGGFQCMKCLKICTAVNRPGFRMQFLNIKLHVNAVHIGNCGRGSGRGRKSQVTLVDEATKTYTIFGLKFKQEGDLFRCLVCRQMIKNSINKRAIFLNMKKHMLKLHVGSTPSADVHPVDDSEKGNFWKDFQSTLKPEADEAPKFGVLTATEEQENLTTEKIEASNSFNTETNEPEDDSLPANAESTNDDQMIDQQTRHCTVEYRIPDSTLNVVDEEKGVYSIFNFKFRELEDGYECGTCFQVLTFHVNEPGKYTYVKHRNIRNHIRKLHFEPERRKSGVVKILDKVAKEYEYEGIKFQEVEGQYKCLECSELCSMSQKKAFTYKYENIRNHIWAVHKKEVKRFKPQMVHREEKIYTHGECEFKQTDKGLECLICHSVQELPLDMMDHIETVHPEPGPRKCPFCNYTYNKWEHFKNHMKYHGPEVICDVCGKPQSRDRLAVHLSWHKRSETRRYPCDQCDKSYKHTSALKAHMQSAHEGLRPYICDQCGMSFALGHHLICHYRTHTTERMFQCTQCERSFRQGHGLKRHVMRAH